MLWNIHIFSSFVGGGRVVKMLGKLSVPWVLLLRILVGQGPVALALGAVGACLDIFCYLGILFSLFFPLSDTAKYRFKYCLKWPLNPKQPTKIFLCGFKRIYLVSHKQIVRMGFFLFCFFLFFVVSFSYFE